MATGANAAGAFVFVEQGTVNAENGFTCTSDTGSAVVGTNNLTFAQFSGAGQIIAGDGLEKSGNTLSTDLKANGGLVIESSELAFKSVDNVLPTSVLIATSPTTRSLAVGSLPEPLLCLITLAMSYNLLQINSYHRLWLYHQMLLGL